MSETPRTAVLQQGLSRAPSKSSFDQPSKQVVQPAGRDDSPHGSIRSPSQTNRLHSKNSFSSLLSTRLCHGIIHDIRARAPYYRRDWTDAWNYRVVPATLLIFFSKCVKPRHTYILFRSHLHHSVLPGIAFSLDLIETTNQYGVAEVLLSSFMAAFVFSVFGAQPLVIAGVTGQHTFVSCFHGSHYISGPITVFNKTIYTILQQQPDAPDYLQFIGWVYLWSAIIHWITAALNCKQPKSLFRPPKLTFNLQ